MEGIQTRRESLSAFLLSSKMDLGRKTLTCIDPEIEYESLWTLTKYMCEYQGHFLQGLEQNPLQALVRQSEGVWACCVEKF